MKRKIALAIAATMAISALTLNASADEYTQVNLLVEGQSVVTDQPAVIVDSRTMVPVRVVAETLGCEVDWDAETKTVTFTQGDVVASMVVGEKKLSVSNNGVATDMEIDVPAVIINSRTMVPVRFLTELFGFNVDWDAETKTVNVTAGEAVADENASGSAVVTETSTEETTEADEETTVADEETTEADEETTEADEETTASDEETTVEETTTEETTDAATETTTVAEEDL